MPNQTLYARPSRNVAPNATWTVTAGTLDTGYDADAVADLAPASAVLAEGTSLTLRATFISAQTLVGIAIVNHNFAQGSPYASVTLTNGAGLSVPLTVPDDYENGLPRGFYEDFTASANRTSTVWNIVITGNAEPVAVGEIVLLTSWDTDIEFLVDTVDDEEYVPTIRHRTHAGVRMVYKPQVAWRTFRGEVFAEDDGVSLQTLARDCEQAGENFVWIPESDINEAFFVHFAERSLKRIRVLSRNHDPNAIGVVRVPVVLEEEGSGRPL